MKPITLEWIEKAEGDFITTLREYRARKNPNYDSACFHAQQCIEKYMKARLQEADIPFGKTHDLSVLLDNILPFEPFWEPLRPRLRTLSVFAIEYRYPGQAADRDIAREAVKICKDIRNYIRLSMGIIS